MRYTGFMIGILIWLLAGSVAGDGGLETDSFWPQWRGPLGTGVAPGADPPVEWGEDQNIRWKIALSGTGHSTPVVWGIASL